MVARKVRSHKIFPTLILIAVVFPRMLTIKVPVQVGPVTRWFMSLRYEDHIFFSDVIFSQIHSTDTKVERAWGLSLADLHC